MFSKKRDFLICNNIVCWYTAILKLKLILKIYYATFLQLVKIITLYEREERQFQYSFSVVNIEKELFMVVD